LKVVVVKGKGEMIGLLVIGVFAAVFLLPVVYMISLVPEARVALAFFVLITGLFLAIGAYMLLIRIGANKRAESLANSASIFENSVSLPEPVSYEIGRVSLRGYWTGSGRNRSYHVDRDFIAERSGTSQSIDFSEGEFKVAIDADGSGIVAAPAVRILSDPYRDVLLIFLTDSGRAVGEGRIQLSHGGDSAEIAFRGEGKAVTGHVQAYLSKARKVRIEISAPEGGRKVAGEGFNFEFRESLLPEEKTLIVTAYKTVSPRSLMKYLEKTVMGHGDFILRAVLDIPLRPDVREERTFRVELEGEEEKEFEEEWGF